MKSVNIDQAKKELDKLVAQVASDHEPVQINGATDSAVLLHDDDWRAVQETLHLLSVPGMRESIREGLQTPVSECSAKLPW